MMATGRPASKHGRYGCCFRFSLAYQEDTSDQESLDELSTAASTPNEVSEAGGYSMVQPEGEEHLSQRRSTQALEFLPVQATLRCEADAEAKYDWWSRVVPEVGLETGLRATSNLISARLVHQDPKVRRDPSTSRQLYEEMAGCDRAWQRTDYVAIWLGIGPRWLVFLCEATDDAMQHSLLSGDALQKRIKLIMRPVKMRLPFPSSPPNDAEYIGPYFGAGAQIDEVITGPSDAQIHGVRVDLYSNWLVKLGLKHIGLLFGNCLDLLVIDWPAKLELASIRLTVTQTFKNQHDGML